VLTPRVASFHASRLPERLAQLALSLCTERRVSDGLQVLRALITPNGLESPIDDYEFELIAQNVIPRVVDVACMRAFAVLCDALEQWAAAEIARSK
jgi:hypothetical protein